MARKPELQSTAGTEDVVALFTRFVLAPETEAARCRERLLEEHAAPLLRKIVARKMRVDPTRIGGHEGPREEKARDLFVQAAVALCGQLDRWRGEPGLAPAPAKFLDYVAVVAFNACKGVQRGTDPQSQVVYLLTRVPGLALWNDAEHLLVGGYSAWREEGRSRAASSVVDEMQRDPEGFALAGLKSQAVE